MRACGLDDIENELQRAVFLVEYRRPRQRLLRLAAGALIFAKHGLRGLLYVWPLALLLFVPLPGHWNWLRVLLGLLALIAFHRYILGSIRDDYARFVSGRLLTPSVFRQVL
ncbi:MAG TPA: hypothetical protein ENJ05_06395 [Thiotrichales bacterium]|nr:hypothetical protein [Thiotrichales bacterium]